MEQDLNYKSKTSIAHYDNMRAHRSVIYNKASVGKDTKEDNHTPRVDPPKLATLQPLRIQSNSKIDQHSRRKKSVKRSVKLELPPSRKTQMNLVKLQ